MRLLTFLLGVFSFSLFSCSNIYVQKLRTPTYFKSKYEINAKASIGLPSYNGSLAASISNHFFLQASGTKSYYNNFNTPDTTLAGGMMLSMTHQFWDIGAGYFTAKEEGLFEIHGGYGRGRSSCFDPPPNGGDAGYYGDKTSRIINTTYHAFYLQPAVGRKKKDNFQLGFSCRFTLLKFDKYEDNVPTGRFRPDNPVFFIEPALDLRGTFKNSPIYAFNNIGLSFKAPRMSGIAYWPLDIQIGLGVHFNQR